MADTSKARPASAMDDSALPAPMEKKPRLELDTEEPIPVESIATSSKPSTAVKPKTQSKRSKRRQKHTLPEAGTLEDVIFHEVTELLGKAAVDEAIAAGTEWNAPFEAREEVDLTVTSMSANGEGLAIAPASKRPWVVVTPFSLPGETIRARVYRHGRMYSHADLISVDTPNPELRDMGRVQCQYFGKCAGCQYQMLSYEAQLKLKRDVVVRAYKTYSELPDSAIPPILDTIGSPLQYGYRTKITPHFDAPPKKAQKQGPAPDGEKPDWLKIGFNQIGTRHVMDIEECPIATPVLNETFRPLREKISRDIYTYKKGVSLLLRDSLEIPSDSAVAPPPLPTSDEKHICVTDHRATVRERVGDNLFEYQAGSFFQNNNSVLIPLTAYVRDAIFPPAATATPAPGAPPPTHLVDAYCGAGLFAIALAPHFATVAGIELSADSIRFAARNAALNALPAGRCDFRSGDAANIFGVVGEFPPPRTVAVVDPPRKGCDDNFLRQLVDFGAGTVVYVSCNVHTQARDVGRILRWSEARGEGKGRYVLESLRGFDLFPQTAHVESVAVLRMVY